MNILSFIDKFGNLSFKEKNITIVDALIFAELSYINFDIIAPSIKEPKSKGIKIKDIPQTLFKKLCEGEFTSTKNAKLLLSMQTSLRYRDIIIKFVEKSHSKKIEKQFFAITLALPNGVHFISFRGTDLLLYSWKEDLSMAFLSKVPAQENAVNYVNEVTRYIKGEYCICGHSKGGNLAFYAALNQNPIKAKRCNMAYSFDGQGFNNETKFNPKTVEAMKGKLTKLVPENCVVGIMLNSNSEYRAIKANGIGVFQHDPFAWRLDPNSGDFLYSKRNKLSFINEKAVRDWTNSLNYEETIFAVNMIFNGFGEIDKSLIDLIKKPATTISNFIKVHYNYSKEEKEKIKSILNRLVYCYKRSLKYYSSIEGKEEMRLLKEKNYVGI